MALLKRFKVTEEVRNGKAAAYVWMTEGLVPTQWEHKA